MAGPAGHGGALDLTSDDMGRIGRYLGHNGTYSAARDLFQAIVGAHARDDGNGPEHPDTLAAGAQLARWTEAAGDAAAARNLYAALLPVNEQVPGPEHPATLLTRGNLASFTGKARDAAAARDLYAALLPVRERVSGLEHPDTATARDNLAYWTGQPERGLEEM